VGDAVAVGSTIAVAVGGGAVGGGAVGGGSVGRGVAVAAAAMAGGGKVGRPVAATMLGDGVAAGGASWAQALRNRPVRMRDNMKV
jgi:hypothetical protein